MGYETTFSGELILNKRLKGSHKKYLEKFSNTRRVLRDSEKARLLADPIRKACRLPIGKDGEFFVGGTGSFGQNQDESVIDYNKPGSTQPGLWCNWKPDEDGKSISCNDGKSYNYIEWLEYIIDNFLSRWGYELNGSVEWYGEDREDNGIIEVSGNKIKIKTKNLFKGQILCYRPEALPILEGLNLKSGFIEELSSDLIKDIIAAGGIIQIKSNITVYIDTAEGAFKD